MTPDCPRCGSPTRETGTAKDGCAVWDCELPLSRGLFTLVDPEDYARFSGEKWYAQGARGREKFYAARRTREMMIYLHRSIVGDPEGFDVDHINGNTLDNRRANLRVVTHQENLRNAKCRKDNTSGFKGVWAPGVRRPRWTAFIRVASGQRRYLGTFPTAELAAQAYDAAAKETFGPYAWLNFPEADVCR